MLELVDVWKSYTSRGVRKSILEGASFSFPRDRNIAIMGRNGAGKSTLMRLLAGIEPPDRGRIRRSTRISWPMGFAGGFNGTMTGVENIRFVARLYGHDPAEVIDSVENFADLGASLRLPIKTYSSGMRARLAFGLSMAIDFQTYLVDEITAVGDANFRKKSRAALERKLGHANLIMISHSPGTIRNYCDCGLLLTGGRLMYYPSIDDLLSAYKADMLGYEKSRQKTRMHS